MVERLMNVKRPTLTCQIIIIIYSGIWGVFKYMLQSFISFGFIYKQKIMFHLNRHGVQIFFLSFPPVQTFRVRTLYATSTKLNHPNFFDIPNVRRQFHSNSFSQELLLCGMDSCFDNFLNSLSQESIAIHPSYPHNCPFLPHLSFISHTPFIITIQQ